MPRGAPKGNFNAPVHGRASPRVRALLDLLLTVPELRQLLLSLWARALEGSPRQRQRYLRILAHRLDDVAALQASQKAQRRRRTESTKRPPSPCTTRREQL